MTGIAARVAGIFCTMSKCVLLTYPFAVIVRHFPQVLHYDSR
jgi:hypothetical protein